MVRGQVATIPAGTGQLLTTLSREEKESVSILNPNDGVVYLRLNGPASIAPTNWDWKVPSQSYGQYPGPWQSIGLYYQDLSGSNAAGQVNIYESDAQLAIPSIVAIGRAAQVAGTQLDITTGTIPQNPPANTVRLWMDGSGHLHLLDSSGNDKTVVDSNNIASYVNPLIAATALGGDLYGTIPNGHVWAHTNPVQLDAGVNVQWGTNSSQDRIVRWTDSNFYYDCAAGNHNFRINGPSIFVISSSGCTVTGALQVNGDVHATRGGSPGSGVYYFGDNSHYLYYDGSAYNLVSGGLNVGAGGSGFGIQVNGYFNGGTTAAGTVGINTLNVGGPLTVSGLGQFNSTVQISGGNVLGWNNGNTQAFESGYLYFRTAASGYVFQSNTGAYDRPMLIGPLYFNDANVMIQRVGNQMQSRSYDSIWRFTDASTNARYSLDCSSQCDHYGNNGGTNHRFFHHDGSWMGTQAANFQVQSSVEHARTYGMPVAPIDDAISKVNAIDPLYYYHMDDIDASTDTPIDNNGHYTYGFSAADVAAVLPEVASPDEHMIDYNRMMPVLWQAVKEIYAMLSQPA